MAQGEEALLFVVFEWCKFTKRSLCSRKKHAQSFGLLTAVNMLMREKYIRQLRFLSVDVTVLVNEALVPLHRLTSLRILDISGKLVGSPDCIRVVL